MASPDAAHPSPVPGTGGAGAEGSKYQSPPPPPSSMTPPPSSQAPQLGPSQARTPTPTLSHLSSPPPTVKASHNLTGSENATGMYTSEQISNATLDELRSMLVETTSACREARASAAHHSLQYNLLRMESSEAMNRMEVELEMVQKEVEVLQTAAHHTLNNGASPAPLAYQTQLLQDQSSLDWKNHCRALEAENTVLRRRLSDAKVALIERETVMAEENERLRNRIRDNRRHVNMLKTLSGNSKSSPVSAPMTAQNQTVSHTHENRHGHYPSTPPTGGDNTFAALLLADQVLSQESATSPSTPTPREPKRHHHPSHTRGSQSLSSLPSTPHRNNQHSTKGYGAYYTGSAPVKSSPARVSLARPLDIDGQIYHQRHTSHQRRESRDSTISASDLEQRAREERDDNSEENSDEEIPASQASQEAANLLRKSASFRKAGSNKSSSAHPSYQADAGIGGSDTIQSKLANYQVKKPGRGDNSTKRKEFHDSPDGTREGPLAKRNKYSEGVGLGIGWGTDRSVR